MPPIRFDLAPDHRVEIDRHGFREEKRREDKRREVNRKSEGKTRYRAHAHGAGNESESQALFWNGQCHLKKKLKIVRGEGSIGYMPMAPVTNVNRSHSFGEGKGWGGPTRPLPRHPSGKPALPCASPSLRVSVLHLFLCIHCRLAQFAHPWLVCCF